MWGEMVSIINIMKKQEEGRNKKIKKISPASSSTTSLHGDLKTDVNLILIPFSIFPHTLFLLISNSSKDLSKQSPHFTPAPLVSVRTLLSRKSFENMFVQSKCFYPLSSTFTQFIFNINITLLLKHTFIYI